MDESLEPFPMILSKSKWAIKIFAKTLNNLTLHLQSPQSAPRTTMVPSSPYREKYSHL